MLKIAAKMVGAYGVLPYDKKIARALSFIDRFDCPYELYRVEGEDMWVPRGVVTEAEHVKYDVGWEIGAKDNFVPRHDDQARVVAESNALLDNGEDFILQAATGYGKTYVGAQMISHLNTRTLVITTKEDCLDQWRDAVRKTCGFSDKEIGIWRADYEPKQEHKVVLGLVHSIMLGPARYPVERFKGFGLTICDEVHRMGAEKFNLAMWWVNSKHRVGLSATPYRKDGKENAFKFHIGPVRIRAEQDVMVPKVIAKATGWKVPMVQWYGAYQKMPHTAGRTMNLDKAMGKSKQRNSIITEFCKAAVAKGRHTIVFTSCMNHLRALHDDFVGNGISPHKIGWYVGLSNYEKGLKREVKLAMREKAKVCPVILATYQMASEATDIPWLDACVLGTPRADVVQIVGRIRREWEGKKQPVVFDLIDGDSRILLNYWKARRRWYNEIGAPITVK